MREPAGPQSNSTVPDDRRPPCHPADDLAWLEGVLQQLQHMRADHDADPRWVPPQVTREAVALAQRVPPWLADAAGGDPDPLGAVGAGGVALTQWIGIRNPGGVLWHHMLWHTST